MTRHANTMTIPDDPSFETGSGEWNAAHATPVVTSAGNHTVVAADAGKIVRVTAAGTVTFNDGVLTVGQDVTILAATTGTVTVASGGSATLVSRGSAFDLAGEWAVATVYCDATDHLVLSGDIA